MRVLNRGSCPRRMNTSTGIHFKLAAGNSVKNLRTTNYFNLLHIPTLIILLIFTYVCKTAYTRCGDKIPNSYLCCKAYSFAEFSFYYSKFKTKNITRVLREDELIIGVALEGVWQLILLIIFVSHQFIWEAYWILKYLVWSVCKEKKRSIHSQTRSQTYSKISKPWQVKNFTTASTCRRYPIYIHMRNIEQSTLKTTIQSIKLCTVYCKVVVWNLTGFWQCSDENYLLVFMYCCYCVLYFM